MTLTSGRVFAASATISRLEGPGMLMSSRITSIWFPFARRRSIAEKPSAASSTPKPLLRSMVATGSRNQASSSSTSAVTPSNGCVNLSGLGRKSWISAGVVSAHGSNTRNVVPLPSSLSRYMTPWSPRTIPCTTASPSPRPADLVVKYGSNILARTSGDIAGVGDFQLQVIAVSHTTGHRSRRAESRHHETRGHADHAVPISERFRRVGDEVHHNLPELRRIGSNSQKIVPEIGLYHGVFRHRNLE